MEARSYPIVNVTEFDLIEDNGNGWGLDANFYVVLDYEGAVPIFGVALGMRPPEGQDFVEDAIYQMYI